MGRVPKRDLEIMDSRSGIGASTVALLCESALSLVEPTNSDGYPCLDAGVA